jgi:hypothetical protein
VDILLSTDVAAVYVRERGWKSLSSARELMDDIGKFLSERLPGSTIDRFDVAAAVLELQSKAVATPEQAQWADDQAQGIGNPADELAMRLADERALAARVAAMDTQQFSEFRKQAGLQRDLARFLGGSE